MKNMVMMFVSGMLGILFLAIVMTICGRMNRSIEVQSNLSSAVEMSVEQMVSVDESEGFDANEAVVECIESVAAAMDTDSEMTVKVYEADAEKGVLAIKAIEQFLHPNGKTGTTEWQRIAIYNRRKETGAECCEVRFYKSREEMLGGGKCYKTYVVGEGEYLLSPAEPMAQGASFAGWKDVNDYFADFSQPVEEDRCYYAEWE